MTPCSDEVGLIRDRLRRPNLLESQTAILCRETSTITRFTFDSSKFGVLKPYCTSKPSTPRNNRSAFRWCNVSSAIGPTNENELLRNVPPVRITSTVVFECSAAMFTALVVIVRLRYLRTDLALDVVVV